MKIGTTSWAAAAALMVIAGAAQAALVKNGDGTSTDTSTKLIWLQNWGVLGERNFDTQKAWADNLVFAGSSDWRLPTLDEYFDLDVGKGSVQIAGGFFNLSVEDFYWSSTEVANDRVLIFLPLNRGVAAVTTLNPNFRFYAVAVRSANVPTAVPAPPTLALALLALGAAALTRMQRRISFSA